MSTPEALDSRDQQLYEKRLLNRYFRGTVVGVTVSTVPLQVQVVRTGESKADGGSYAVGPQWYYPLAGDDVELLWRDDYGGWVAWPRITPGRRHSKMVVTPSQPVGISALAWQIVSMGGIAYDRLSIANTTKGGFVIAVAGYYVFRGRATIAGTVRGITAIYQNGAEVARGHDSTNSTSTNSFQGGLAIASLSCSVGDLIQLAAFSGTAANYDTGTGVYPFLEAEWSP